MTAFREHLEAHGGKAENIRYICCDMEKGFRSGIENEFPDAIVTYDRFHVMEHMTLAVDKARRHEWNSLRENGRLKEATDLKGQRFLLLRNKGNLKSWQESRIDSIMSVHKELGTVYSLKDIISLVDRNFEEILHWFNSRMSNGVMEGINSVIQAVKSRARGYRRWENLRTMCYRRASGLC